VRLQLLGSKSADVLANSVEGFVARTSEEILEFLRAQLPDPSTAAGRRRGPEVSQHTPGAAACVGRLMQNPDPGQLRPDSLSCRARIPLHRRDGTSRFGRYHFIPEAGEEHLSPSCVDAAKVAPELHFWGSAQLAGAGVADGDDC
jgi:catalase